MFHPIPLSRACFPRRKQMQFLVELGTSGWPGHPQPPAGSDELQDSGQAHPPTTHLTDTGGESVSQSINPRTRAGSPSSVPGWALGIPACPGGGPARRPLQMWKLRDGEGGRGRGGGRQSADFDSPSQPRERCTGLHAGVRDQPPRPTWSTRV